MLQNQVAPVPRDNRKHKNDADAGQRCVDQKIALRLSLGLGRTGELHVYAGRQRDFFGDLPLRVGDE